MAARPLVAAMWENVMPQSIKFSWIKPLPVIAGALFLSLAVTNEGDAAPPACLADPAWFPHADTPRPNDGATFTINCQFHQWSWQMFLWLTQTVDGTLRFETFPTNNDVTALAGGKIGAPVLAPRFGKSNHGAFNEVAQAGSEELLIDQNGRAVYYSQYLNMEFLDFIKTNNFTDSTALYNASPTLNWPLTMTYENGGETVAEACAAATSDPVKTYCAGIDGATGKEILSVFCDAAIETVQAGDSVFPALPELCVATSGVGGMEIKVSWKILGDGDDPATFFTKQAEVAKLVSDTNGNIVPGPETETATVGLVGFHIAGRVREHPEAIWATFEHNSNAPNMQEGPNAGIPIPPGQVISDMDWTFFKKGGTAQDCNLDNSASIHFVDEKAQMLAPVTEVCRQYPNGGGSFQNVTNIEVLNASVQQHLAKSDPADVIRNYREIGAIWFNAINGLVPNSQAQDHLTGSIVLSNSTIETFTQVDLGRNNCFQCHNSLMQFPPQQPGKPVPLPLPGKNFMMSHILLDIYNANPLFAR